MGIFDDEKPRRRGCRRHSILSKQYSTCSGLSTNTQPYPPCLTDATIQAGSATLQFVGRGISVWGPSRPDSSRFEVRLDGDVVGNGELGTGSNESALLYRVSSLAPGLLHTLQITNDLLDLQRPWLRIDKFEVELGTDGSDNVETIMDDSDHEINYTGKRNGWSTEAGDKNVYHDGTFQ